MNANLEVAQWIWAEEAQKGRQLKIAQLRAGTINQNMTLTQLTPSRLFGQA